MRRVDAVAFQLLDDILDRLIGCCHSKEEIIVLRMVKNAEFKPKQAAPGLKVTSRAFGTGWRMPHRWTAVIGGLDEHLDCWLRKTWFSNGCGPGTQGSYCCRRGRQFDSR